MSRPLPWLPVLLGFLTAVGPVSTDVYLPAFPAIDATFGMPGGAQLTLAAWFAGLSCGQLMQGALSDRFGRRAPMIAGMSLYMLSSAGCALAPSIGAFCAFRFLQAIGGSAMVVVPRAMVRDMADGPEAARMLGFLMLIMGVAPIVAPTLGGLVQAFATWRDIFWGCTAFGLISFAVIITLVPDTLPPERRVPLHLPDMLRRYRGIVVERGFLSHTTMMGMAMFGLFAYLGGSPAAFIQQYHLPPALYGAIFGMNAIGYIGAAQVNGRLVGRLGGDHLLRVASTVYLVATALLMVTAWTGWGGLAGLMLPLVIAQGSLGFVSPNATVGALTRHAAHAGSASALMGTLQFVLAALSGIAVGALSDGTARPMATLMLVGAVGAKLADLARPRG